MKRRTKKKYLRAALAIGLALAMCVCYGSLDAGAAFAAKSKAAGQTAASEKIGVERDNTFAFHGEKEIKQLRKKAVNYPDSFDLRNVDGVSYVTPVRLQNPFGTCWGFGAAAAAESSILADPVLGADYSHSVKQGEDGKEVLDLSEKHIAYFVTSFIDDPKNSQDGEGIHFRNLSNNDLETSAYRYDTGGFTLYATSIFAQGMGPLLENAPDPENPGQTLERFLGYKGARAEKVERRVGVSYDENGNVAESARRPVWNSKDDDWSIPEKYKFGQSFRLRETTILPQPSSYDKMNKCYSLNKDALNAIKQQMCENHRAVSMAFCAETFLPGQDTAGKKYMSDKWAHFTNTYQDTNHVVTIVGWDDNYPASNFLHSNELVDKDGNPCNGAFLVKNSWGSELNGSAADKYKDNGFRHWGILEGEDGVPYDPNAKSVTHKSTGYFWISYHDRSMTDLEAFDFDRVTEENAYDTDQTDYGRPEMFYDVFADDLKVANVFECKETTELKEISVMTTSPGTKVSYNIYALPENFDDPESGLLIARGSDITFDYGGYHRIRIDDENWTGGKSVKLARNQKYSVVVTENGYVNDDTGKINYAPIGSAYNNPGSSMFYVTIVNKGESYCHFYGEWHDESDKELQRIMVDSDNEVVDNFPIKAYNAPADFTGYLAVNNWQEGTPGSFTMYEGDEKTLASEFRGTIEGKGDDWDPAVTWESGDPDVVTVEPKDERGGSAVIKGVSEGKTYITVRADEEADGDGEYGTRVIGIEIKKPSVSDFSFDDSDKTYTGKAIEPKVAGVWFDEPDGAGTVPAEGVNYKVEYKDNVKPGTATVTVSGIGDFGGSVSKTFKINKAANTMKASGKKVTVKAKTLKKKKKVTVKAVKAYTITSAKGTLTYAKVSLNKKKYANKFSVNEKSGNITVKKGVKKGKYKLSVKIKAAGTDCYKAAEKNVAVVIKVK